MNEQVTLNGVEVWVYIVEQDGGYRLRLSLDDWDRCRLHRGERIPLQRYRQNEEQLFLAEAVEMPPVVWFNLMRASAIPTVNLPDRNRRSIAGVQVDSAVSS